MGKEYVSIESDISEAVDMLTAIGGKESTIMRKTLSDVGTGARKKIKSAYSSILGKQTGYLYRTIHKAMYKNGKAVFITAHKKTDVDGERYGFVLAHGATILPKKSNGVLTLKDKRTGAILARTKSVTIPPKDFIVGPGKEYLNSGAYKTDIEKSLKKQIEKIEEKAAKKR